MTKEHRGHLLFYAGGIFCLFIGIIALRTYMGLITNTSIYVGFVIGGILGIFASIYLHLTWATRIAKGQEAITTPPRIGCLLPLVVSVGAILGSYLLQTVQLNIKDTFSVAFLSFFIVCSAFILFKTIKTQTID